MRLILFALLALGVSFGAQSAEAKGKERKESLHDQYSGQGYGLAGCGLGSIVFGPKPGMIQIVAATLNGTGGSQTFGISTGTSNCDMPEMAMAAATFIEVNREVVAKDAARGEGESLNNLATIFKCSDYSRFGTVMQQEYSNVFAPEKDSYDAGRAIVKAIESDEQLASACAPIS